LRVARTFGFSFFGFLTSFFRLLLPLPMMNSWFGYFRKGDGAR
jgi:hypothetical protein